MLSSIILGRMLGKVNSRLVLSNDTTDTDHLPIAPTVYLVGEAIKVAIRKKGGQSCQIF